MEPETPVEKPKRSAEKYFTKKEWGLIWKTALATLGLVGITVGPLVGWILKAKEEQLKSRDDQIATLSKANSELAKSSNTNLDETLKVLQAGMARFAMAFPFSTFDGKVAMGQGLSGKATPITEQLATAEELINSKQFDAAEEHLNAVDKIWPEFPGANFQRFRMLQMKGQGFEKEAEKMADKVIPNMVDAVDFLKPLYAFSINEKLKRGERAAAEQLFLKLVRNFPSETNFVSEFSRIFGYTPSTKN